MTELTPVLTIVGGVLRAALYSSITGQFNQNLPVPYVITGATYSVVNLTTGAVGIPTINATQDAADFFNLTIPPPVNSVFRLTASWTANGIPQMGSTYLYFTLPNSVYSPSFIQGRGTNTLTVIEDFATLPVTWFRNYNQIAVQPSIAITTNGIYEARFTDGTFNYISAVEVTNLAPATYIRLSDDLGNVFGVTGTPRSVTTLNVSLVRGNGTFPEPIRYAIYVNNVYVSDFPSISLTQLAVGDIIDVVARSCGVEVARARTFILGIPPLLI